MEFLAGDTTNTDTMRINFLDSNGNNVASVYANKNVGGSQYLSFQVYTTDNNNANITSIINYYISKSGDKSFVPYEDSQISLGGSVRRWKSVYATNYYYGSNNVEFSTKFVTTDTAQTISGNKTFSSINGVEPSSLSLPDLSNGIDISSYLTNAGTTTPSEYTPLVNGYICIKISADSPSFIRMYNDYGFDNTVYTERNEGGSASGGTYTRFASLIFPANKDVKVYIIIMPSTSGIISAKFFPCQGNV